MNAASRALAADLREELTSADPVAPAEWRFAIAFNELLASVGRDDPITAEIERLHPDAPGEQGSLVTNGGLYILLGQLLAADNAYG